MNALIRTVPIQKIPNGDIGFWSNGPTDVSVIEVGDSGDDDTNMLVALHELVEAYLCKKAGVTSESVSAFDRQCADRDPGSNAAAPYRIQHSAALRVEALMAEILGVPWAAHEAKIDAAVAVK